MEVNDLDWKQIIISALTIICMTILVMFDKLDPERFMDVLMLILGSIIGISVGYALGYVRGKQS